MTAKRLAARLTAAITALAFIVGISAGAYSDAGGWSAFAAVWGAVAVLAGMARAFVWAIENWNAP